MQDGRPLGTTLLPWRFTGIFDGKGFTISNLYINNTTINYIGLFGYVGTGGEVQNLGLLSTHVTGSRTGSRSVYAGGLVGGNKRHH